MTRCAHTAIRRDDEWQFLLIRVNKFVGEDKNMRVLCLRIRKKP